MIILYNSLHASFMYFLMFYSTLFFILYSSAFAYSDTSCYSSQGGHSSGCSSGQEFPDIINFNINDNSISNFLSDETLPESENPSFSSPKSYYITYVNNDIDVNNHQETNITDSTFSLDSGASMGLGTLSNSTVSGSGSGGSGESGESAPFSPSGSSWSQSF